MQTEMCKVTISICGPSGSGKSYVAQSLVTRLGAEASVRVPSDYYIVPAEAELDPYLARPLQYDWDLLKASLEAPVDAVVTTPQFDFERFQRLSPSGGRPFTLRSICVIDAMYPCPFAAVKVLLRVPSDVRRARIIERDTEWGTQVAHRWKNLELSRLHLEAMDVEYDAVINGADPVSDIVTEITELIRGRMTAQQR